MSGPLRWVAVACVAAFIALPERASAHVGSPNVFVDAHAGPYRVLVTVRPPRAIPGAAGIEILTFETDVRAVRIVPMPLTGPGAEFAPVPDRLRPSSDNPRLYVGELWMMTAGAWQVRVAVDGARGSGVVAVPVPTLPEATLDMSSGLRALLCGLMLVLCLGFVSIVAAFGREATLPPGEAPGPQHRRRGWLAGAAAAVAVAMAMVLGDWWWAAEAANYGRYVYKPLEASTSITPDGRLTMSVRDPGWISLRRTDDFVPDHGHVMHLFVLSPSFDRFWHLHPDETGAGTFKQRLPDFLPGEYRLFADVVHATGISETILDRVAVPDIHGAALTADDSAWSEPASGVAVDAAPLPDGARMVWLHEGLSLKAGRVTRFEFRVDDAAGHPATDLELYMGMPAHAIFVSHNGRVFAHVHPSGSAPMAALEIGQRSLPSGAMTGEMDHGRPGGHLPAVVSFPFGLPEQGDYRIFVQVKRNGRIDTGAFDVRAE